LVLFVERWSPRGWLELERPILISASTCSRSLAAGRPRRSLVVLAQGLPEVTVVALVQLPIFGRTHQLIQGLTQHLEFDGGGDEAVATQVEDIGEVGDVASERAVYEDRYRGAPSGASQARQHEARVSGVGIEDERIRRIAHPHSPVQLARCASVHAVAK
jgi:hypothetical protein